MSAELQIHASCVAFGEKGVLLCGASGAGKSETALRLMVEGGAVLVADDRVGLWRDGDDLWACAPEKIAGLIEVREVGILKVPFCAAVKIALCVRLLGRGDPEREKISRLPEPEMQIFLDRTVRRLTLPAGDSATPAKIRAALLFETVTDTHG